MIEAELASPQLNDADRCSLLGYQCEMLHLLNRAKEADKPGQAALALAEKLQAVGRQDDPMNDYRMAWALSHVGRCEEAIAAIRRCVDAARVPDQQASRWNFEESLARYYAYYNRPKECVAVLARLLRAPCLTTVPMLRVDPAWDPVRSDPGFQALLNDPKNDEPF